MRDRKLFPGPLLLIWNGKYQANCEDVPAGAEVTLRKRHAFIPCDQKRSWLNCSHTVLYQSKSSILICRALSGLGLAVRMAQMTEDPLAVILYEDI
jgi:hypothetical protein